MSLVYNEEQRMLIDSAREFLASRSPVQAQRELRDSQSELGFDPELWSEMVELGWTAITFPESLGGLEFGFKGMGAIFEEIGKNLSASPLLSSIVLSGSILQYAGNEEQVATWLAPLISGEKRLALAVDEGNHHRPDAQLTLATEQDGHFVLSGQKVMVLDGVGADGWIVSARTLDAKGDSRITLFLVTPEMAGVTLSRQSLIDSRNVARLTLDKVVVPAANLVGQLGEGESVLNKALILGRVCLAAEMLGACETLFAMTLEYLKTRVQFDTKIGSFQALQHRCSWMYVDLQLARSTLMAAMHAIDTDAEDVEKQVSLAKWKVGQMADKVTSEAVQMHGGIGVTDELDIGLYLKRVRVAQHCLGDADYQLARYMDA
jgi:hypothetical protein